MSEGTAGAVARFRAAVDARTRAEVEEAVAIAELAAAHEWTAAATFDVIGTRPVRIGADGTALVDEFLPLEVAVVKGISVASATWLIRDIVNLKARHPLLWIQATAGLIPMFRAFQLAAEVARFDLSLDQARELDEQLAPKVPIMAWRRILHLARGLITDLAPDKVAALQQQARTARFVRKLPTDDPMVAYLSARVDTADAIFFDAMIDRIADILGTGGDTDTKDIRRAKAVGILATPARAQLMLTEARAWAEPDDAHRPTITSTDPRLLPEACIYVHVAEETLLHGSGTARVEGIGPLAATMLGYLLGHTRVRATPVIRPYADIATDAYEIPDPIRRQVLLRDSYEIFPYSSRTARTADLDHTIPYRAGAKRQTRAANLGPLTRKPHRAKTHANWQLEQPTPGIFWWTTPTGDQYRVTPNGTNRPGKNPRHRPYEHILWDDDHAVRQPPDRSGSSPRIAKKPAGQERADPTSG